MSILDEPVLVLNCHWQAIGYLPVRTCIENAMRQQASIMDVENHLLLTFEEWMLHEPKDARWIKTSSGRIAAPVIVVLRDYDKRPPRHVPFKKITLARRDEWMCQYCGEPLEAEEVTIDHVFPRSRGGANSWENCVSACGRCNGAKADRTPQEAGMRLRKQPKKPDWKPRMELPRRGFVHPSWRPFIEKELASA